MSLYIDSLDTGRFDAPDRSPEETALKNDPNHYGKLIPPNWGDFDHDGILDCWDGSRNHNRALLEQSIRHD